MLGGGGTAGGCLFTQVLCPHGVNLSGFRTEWVMGSQVEPIPSRSEQVLPADGLSGWKPRGARLVVPERLVTVFRERSWFLLPGGYT